MNSPGIFGNLKISYASLLAPIVVLLIIIMMVLPLPPIFLDFMFTFNIAFALIILLAGVYSLRPLDFSIFPTVLLMATLLRLSLNVASTRVVLLNGHTGTDAAGQVVESFGSVVVGGNYTVGLVVFAILVVINFVVITKGAGRVSEVSARFTLDALPGKQMAIDADLNAGVITQQEAKQRREDVARESDFYGSMDGASKFVRGDAIAAILILVINIVGGLIIGIAQHDMNFADAMHNYALLTIGDGLVAQVPALLLSTAAAIMVTRVSSKQDMSSQFIEQVFGNPKALMVAAGVVASIGIIPGMPHVAFLGLSAIVGSVGYYQNERKKTLALQVIKEEEKPKKDEPTEKKELSWEDVTEVDIVGLQVGYRLIPLVDESQGGQLLARVKGVRKKLSQDLGFLIPAVHIRDNLDLAPNNYRLSLAGVTIAEAEIYPEKHMAINPGQVFGELDGTKTMDPAFGLEAIWIEESKREHAKTLGYTVVDASTVVATHLSQVLQDNAAQMLGHEEVQQLLDRLSKSAPKLVSELVPDQLSLGTVVKVLQSLLEEGIPIRDMRTITESLAECAAQSKEADVLLGTVRESLSRLIVQNINGLSKELPVITLQPDLEQILQSSLQAMQDGQTGFEPTMAEKLQRSLSEVAQRQEVTGEPAVLLVQPGLRQILAKFISNTISNLHVLSYREIPTDKQIKVVGTVG